MPRRIATSSFSSSTRAARRRNLCIRRPGRAGRRNPLAIMASSTCACSASTSSAVARLRERAGASACAEAATRHLVAGHLHGSRKIERGIRGARRDHHQALAAGQLRVRQPRGLVAEHQRHRPFARGIDEFHGGVAQRRGGCERSRGREVNPAASTQPSSAVASFSCTRARGKDVARAGGKRVGFRIRITLRASPGRGVRRPWSSSRARRRRCCRDGAGATAPCAGCRGAKRAFIV